MVGLPSSTFLPAQSEAASARSRPDVARNPAVSGPNASGTDIRRTLAEPRDERSPRQPDAIDSAAIERRVEARQAAEDARLERFRADELPFASARALDVFAAVAGQRDGGDVEMAGIDIRV
ncbi:UDP pyrophosphate phosphatase [Marinobacter salicampi]|uniref:UDP pyrophosphate phosphatase n=1 Tax=Marinobacter salicampi TaxID=435907 RepID=UPI00140E5862|nr:UDP pyrophosphate phosphatase [Marinobacter salicampi]